MKKLLIVVMGMVLFAGLCAADSALTLEQARELALSNSRTLASAALTVQSNELTQKTQYFSLLPKVNLTADAGVVLWNNNGFTQDISNGATAGISLNVTETLPLWDAKKYSIQKILNNLSTEQARQDALAEYFSVLSAVDTAYYNVRKAIATLESAENALETANVSLAIAEIRRQNSMINEAGYLQALANKEKTENSRNDARRSLSLARLTLKNLLGLETLPEPEPVDFSALDSLLPSIAAMDDADFERVYERLWKNIESRNPGLIKAGIDTVKADQNLKSAVMGYSPTVNATANMGLSYDFLNGTFKIAEGKVGVTATIPLDFWNTGASVKKSRLSVNQQALTYQSKVESLDIDVQRALVSLISQAGQTLSSARTLEYARLNFDHVMELYRMNQNSLSALIDAEKLRLDSANNLTNARYEALSALSTLRSLGAFEDEEAVIALLRS
ncbi:MAG: TolC family protein [Treponema sp.]|nr:TolC family protein [Treponema sp.]